MNLGKVKILVAEDEVLLLNSLVKKIASLGQDFEVMDTALNGKIAYEKVKQLQPDVIITDIKMPIMDGITLVKKLADEDINVKIIILSGFSDFTYAQKAIQYGVSNYIVKPIDIEELRDSLTSIRKQLMEEKHQYINNLMEENIRGRIALSGDTSNLLLDETFFLFTITIGNFTNNSFSKVAADRINNIWNLIRLDDLMSNLFSDYWIMEERANNSKVVIIPNELADIHKKIRLLFDRISIVTDIPITFCYINDIRYKELKATVGKVKKYVEINHKIGKGGLFQYRSYIANHKKKDHSFDEALLETLVDSNNMESLKIELYKIIYCIGSKYVKQIYYKSKITELVSFLQTTVMSISSIEIYELTNTMNDIIAYDYTIENINEKIYNSIINAFSIINDQYENGPLSISSVVHYIESNYNRDITIDELSEVFYCNVNQLMSQFKEHVKYSPIQYLIHYRIKKAKELIMNHDELSFKEVCFIVGYKDPQYFSRVFKKVTGRTPSQYKKMSS